MSRSGQQHGLGRSRSQNVHIAAETPGTGNERKAPDGRDSHGNAGRENVGNATANASCRKLLGKEGSGPDGASIEPVIGGQDIDKDDLMWKSIILKQLSAYADDADIPKILEREYAGGHPLVRAACVHLAEFLPHADRIKRAFASDASRLVRIDAGLRFKTEKRNTEELMEYLDFNADSPIGALKRSEYMLSEGRFDDAVKGAVAAVRMEPGNSEIKLQSAILLFRAGDFSRSESLFKSVCDGDPRNAHAHYLYGLFLGEMGRLAESADLFEKSVRADANFIRGWYNLSVAYLKLGMADKASETRRP